MITALDHFVLVCPKLGTAVADYTALLGAEPAWLAESDGIGTAVFAVGNTALELMAPTGDGAVAGKLYDMTKDGAVMTSLVYRTDDVAGDRHLMTRRGLAPSEISETTSTHLHPVPNVPGDGFEFLTTKWRALRRSYLSLKRRYLSSLRCLELPPRWITWS